VDLVVVMLLLMFVPTFVLMALVPLPGRLQSDQAVP